MEDKAGLCVFAQIQKTFGKEGELMIKYNSALSDLLIESIEKQGPVFLIIDEIPVPFYFKSVQPKGPGKSVVRFENFLTEPLVAEFVGRTIFYKSSEILTEEQSLTQAEMWDEIYIDPAILIGYTFTGKTADNRKVSGKVCEAFDYPGNPCVELDIKETGTKILVPCHPDLLLDVDSKKKRLNVSIPRGLL